MAHPTYADGFGRWHVLVPQAENERGVAIIHLAAEVCENFKTWEDAIDYLSGSVVKAEVSDWDQSAAFGGVPADTEGMAHYIEYAKEN